MHILILNWRDPKNPKGGGAETLTHEMAKRWAKGGHKVTQFSSGFKESKKEEIIDGVRIIRQGSWFSVHVLAFFYYVGHATNIDIIIDEVHWFPFFSLFYARKKTILLACEVAGDLFFKLLPYPLALLGRLIEKAYLWSYRKSPILAISESTKRDLINEGFLEKNITILPMGTKAPEKIKIVPKEKQPTLIYVGRINKLKGIDDAVDAFSKVKKQIPNCKLWIVGKGEESYVKKIKKKISFLKLEHSVTFFGYVLEEKKFELMGRAHLLIAPSVKEGWGLIVPEAGIVGTPAVAYNVQGLRDVIKNGKNGILVKSNPRTLAGEITKILNNKNLYKNLHGNALSYARQLDWDQTARVGLEKLKEVLSKEIIL